VLGLSGSREGEEEGGNVTEEYNKVLDALEELPGLVERIKQAELDIAAGVTARPLLSQLKQRRGELVAIIHPPRKRKPKVEKPKRGRPKGSRNKKIVEKSAGDTKDTTPANISFPDEAELRKQAICRNPSTGQGCGKLLSQCVCGADITLPKKEDEGA
jgi:hypothetical protein